MVITYLKNRMYSPRENKKTCYMDHSKAMATIFLGQKCGGGGGQWVQAFESMWHVNVSLRLGVFVQKCKRILQDIIIPEWKSISATVFVGGNSNSPWSIHTGELCRVIWSTGRSHVAVHDHAYAKYSCYQKCHNSDGKFSDTTLWHSKIL